MRCAPEHIRFDNGAEMTAKVVRNWLTQVGAKTLYIDQAAPGRTAGAPVARVCLLRPAQENGTENISRMLGFY